MCIVPHCSMSSQVIYIYLRMVDDYCMSISWKGGLHPPAIILYLSSHARIPTNPLYCGLIGRHVNSSSLLISSKVIYMYLGMMDNSCMSITWKGGLHPPILSYFSSRARNPLNPLYCGRMCSHVNRSSHFNVIKGHLYVFGNDG
jgi:hypothetical protein